MSFILDALKKSENDRQEKRAPDISDVPTAQAQTRTSPIVWYLVGFLSLVVIALLAVLLKPAAGPAPIVSTALPLPASRAPDTSPPPPAAAPRARPAAAPRTSRPATQPAARPQQSAPATTARAPAPTPAPAPAPAPEPVSDPVQEESLLTFNDLRATGSLDLPDLHIDLHVFSDTPDDRFVFINMNRYGENAVLSEGPRLKQITPEGVMLEYVGTTFLLPRE